MTIEELITEALISRGMFESQASQVIKLAKDSPHLIEMKVRWKDDSEDYPQVITNLVWMSTKEIALSWIKDTCPNAWFLPMFK